MRAVLIAAAFWGTFALAAEAPPSTPPPAAPAAVASKAADAPAAAAIAAPAKAPAPTATAAANAGPGTGGSGGPEEANKWGVILDGGAPEGVGLMAAWRPLHWVRVSAGGMYNMLSGGIRGGVSLIPFYFPITPSLNFEAGHYFPGDISGLLAGPLGSGGPVSANELMFKEIGYDYMDAHLGLEIGAPKVFTFFLRFGISYLQTTLHHVQELLQNVAGASGPTIIADDITFRLTLPSVKLGFIVYFM